MKPLVSICCITYNQEKYIGKTIESFLMQQTNFAFEILIHDDASQDGTPDIIKKYQAMYPGLIKPILQTENKLSQGVEVDYVYNFSRANGKYVAYCEGDDYWTDLNKLQKQVAFMEEHPDVSACIHADKHINEAGERVLGYRRAFNQNHYATMQEVIQMDGRFTQNSMMYRNEAFRKQPLPDWYFNAPVTDYALLIFLAMQGRIYFMNDVMSAYRKNAINSWTRSVYGVPEKRRKHYAGLHQMLEHFNHDTDYRYNQHVKEQIYRNEFYLAHIDKNLKQLKSPLYRPLYQELSLVQKIKVHLATYLPLSLAIHNWLRETGKLYIFKPKETFQLK